MGICFGKGSEEQQVVVTANNGKRVKAFQGEGHRLGTTTEEGNSRTTGAGSADNRNRSEETTTSTPSPLDPNLTDEERANLRANRAAAAEARLKKQQVGKGKSKTRSKPLRDDNSAPLMRWTAG